ncbi:bifunctional hydroxymethylpyrimidine kinase/phosphomethylpyrimidine kinase [Desulfurobacterium indicum]|uniref:bifunctional hydroxymethylpyrimidine kinase/phosphomethylpyrimidine kinase n=1 Tax=Desulfurobacterium indicum TaxID=1914305 RepID=UPI00098EDBDB
MEKPETLLTIAGFDPTGGAGILRDTSIFRYSGFYGTAVITANTAQNTAGVTDILFQPADLIKNQIKAIQEDFKISGIKIGLPHHDRELNIWIANFIKENKILTVFDPVLKPTSGKTFVENISSIKPLLEASTVITPNYSEYQQLKKYIDGIQASIIVKGIVKDNKVEDILIENGKETLKISHRIRKKEEVRGTGCAFSSYLLTLLMKTDLKTAFKKSCKFLQEFREKAVFAGSGKQKINLECREWRGRRDSNPRPPA